MFNFNLTVLYVQDAQASSAFYENLLGRSAAQSSSKFVVFPLDKGALLGLWQRDDVGPRSTAEAGSSEIPMTVADAEAVHAAHDA